MRRSLFFFLTLALVAKAANGQCFQRHSGIALSNSGGYAKPIAGANVSIWSDSGCSTSSLVMYSNSTCTTPVSQPLIADVNGNYSFYTNSNSFNEKVSGVGLTATCQPVVPAVNTDNAGPVTATEIKLGYGASKITLLAGTPPAPHTITFYNNIDGHVPLVERANTWTATQSFAAVTSSAATFSRFNDIRVAGQSFSGGTTIAAALADAGTSGSVLIPPSYLGTDTYANQSNSSAPAANIIDLRASSAQTQQPVFYFRRVNDSAPTTGSSSIPINPYYDPAFRFDVVTQSGAVTGSHGVLFANMPSVKGKNWTTTTQVITGGPGAQSVGVVDSSAFVIGETLEIDTNYGFGVTEDVVVTGKVDGTHVSGVFANNHTIGARIGVRGKGDKISSAFAIGDQTGNTDINYAINPNCTANSSTSFGTVCGETDVTTNVTAGTFFGDRTGPYTLGHDIVNAGTHDSSSGLDIVTNNSSTFFLKGIGINGAKNFGIAIEQFAPATGISISTSTIAGIKIGANQVPSNPNSPTSDPTDAIFLTTRTQADGVVNAPSNRVTFQSRAAGVDHVFHLIAEEASTAFWFAHDTVTPLPKDTAFVSTTGAFNTPEGIYLRNTTTGAVNAQWTSTGTATTVQPIGGATMAVNPTTIHTSSTIVADGAVQLNNFAQAGHAMCQKADKTIGYCSTAIAADGTCGCN